MMCTEYDRRTRLHYYHTIKRRNTRVTTERGKSGRSVASASSRHGCGVCRGRLEVLRKVYCLEWRGHLVTAWRMFEMVSKKVYESFINARRVPSGVHEVSNTNREDVNRLGHGRGAPDSRCACTVRSAVHHSRIWPSPATSPSPMMRCWF